MQRGDLELCPGAETGFPRLAAGFPVTSVTWQSGSGDLGDWKGSGSRTWAQILSCLKSNKGSKRSNKSLPMSRGNVSIGEMYTGCTKLMGPMVRWMGAICSSWISVWLYDCTFSSHFRDLRVRFCAFALSLSLSKRLVDIKVMSAPVSTKASIFTSFSTVMAKYSFRAIPFSIRFPRSLGPGAWVLTDKQVGLVTGDSFGRQTTKTALSGTVGSRSLAC